MSYTYYIIYALMSYEMAKLQKYFRILQAIGNKKSAGAGIILFFGWKRHMARRIVRHYHVLFFRIISYLCLQQSNNIMKQAMTKGIFTALFRNINLPFLASILLLAACSKDDNGGQPLPEGEYPMTFTAAGIALSVDTKATTDNNWQGVQQVAVLVDGAVKPYDVEASGDYATATLSSSDPFYWQSTDPITVSAWWPYAETMPDVVVQADQSSEDNFHKSDYISATNTIEFDGPHALQFTHRTAKVTVALECGDGMTDEELAQATVTLTSITTGNAADGNTVTPYQNTTALLPPQTIAAGQPFIQITLAPGVTYVYKTEEAAQLEGGYQYTYTITVSKAGLDLAGNSISSWTDNPGGTTEGTATLPYTYDASTATYTVYTPEGLDAWAADVRGGNRYANCILANDIDYGGRTWGGTGSNSYSGTFDGGGNTLSNMVIPASGLVGYLKGTVQNLVLDDVELQTANSYHGLIARTNFGTIAGCTVLSSCKIICNSSGYIGGIAGHNNDGLITHCHAECSFEGSNSSATIGGIAGSNKSSITASSYKGSCNVNGNAKAGSLIGYSNGGNATACWASVKLVSSVTMTGMVNRQENSTLTACYWEGDGIMDNGTGTQVTDGNWTEAINDMNNNLPADFGWHYVAGGGSLPTLVPDEQ